MSQPAAAIEPAPAGPETPEPGERVYFPELDGMRFIAFLLVYLFHQGVPWALLTKSFQSLADTVNLCLGGAHIPSRFFSRTGLDIPSPGGCRRTADTESSSFLF